MPKGKLEFNLPEEEPEFEAACDGMSRKIAVDEFASYLMRFDKHRDPDEKKASEVLEEIRAKWTEVTGNLRFD